MVSGWALHRVRDVPVAGRVYQLAVVDCHTGKPIVVEARVAVDEYRWSPDSRWIAVEGVERGPTM